MNSQSAIKMDVDLSLESIMESFRSMPKSGIARLHARSISAFGKPQHEVL